MPTVNVFGLFTRNAFSSATDQERRARLERDVASANAVWNRCGINFVAADIYDYTNLTINAASFSSNTALNRGTSSDNIIREVRTQQNDRAAIYLVYLSGTRFADGASGVGGPEFSFNRSPSDYGLVGHLALPDAAANSRIHFPHEAGHILFSRFDSTGRFDQSDPSGPFINPQTGERDIFHNNDPQNLMYAFTTAAGSNTALTPLQCQVANQSKVIAENANGPLSLPIKKKKKLKSNSRKRKQTIKSSYQEKKNIKVIAKNANRLKKKKSI